MQETCQSSFVAGRRLRSIMSLTAEVNSLSTLLGLIWQHKMMDGRQQAACIPLDLGAENDDRMPWTLALSEQ